MSGTKKRRGRSENAGNRKTLSAVHKVVGSYKQYNDKKVWCPRRKRMVTQRIKVISNVALSIPYEDFVSLEQIVLAAERNKEYDDEHDTLTVTLVLGDEFSVQMNSRNFKTNIDPLFLNTILTCRHYYISMVRHSLWSRYRGSGPKIQNTESW